MAYYNAFPHSGKDFYKILRVSQTASLQEIKTSYRQIAMELHPDKHEGCPKKVEQFKLVNEAYAILTDISKRRDYDYAFFRRTTNNKNRSSPLPKDYRKVYAPRPPPDWKYTWDHQKHYDMHYGDGFQKEAIKQAKKQAEKDGAFEYHSPLGKGFAFHFESGSNDTNNFNPYSKYSPQGPPKVIFEYEEGEMSDRTRGKMHVHRREQIINEMHTKRNIRHRQQQQQQQQQKMDHQQQRYNATDSYGTNFNGYNTNNIIITPRSLRGYNNNHTNKNDCVIL